MELQERLYQAIGKAMDAEFDACEAVNPDWRVYGTADRFNRAMKRALRDYAARNKYL